MKSMMARAIMIRSRGFMQWLENKLC